MLGLCHYVDDCTDGNPPTVEVVLYSVVVVTATRASLDSVEVATVVAVVIDCLLERFSKVWMV